MPKLYYVQINFQHLSCEIRSLQNVKYYFNTIKYWSIFYAFSLSFHQRVILKYYILFILCKFNLKTQLFLFAYLFTF